MIKNWIKGTIILCIFWIVLSGHFEMKYIVAGFMASAIISCICVPLMHVKQRNGEKYSILDINIFRFIGYWIWLFIEICKASLSVAVTVLKPKMDIQPQVIEFYCTYQNPIAITMLINSIILTPGTVTLDVKEDSTLFVVHALTDSAAEGLLEGTMQRRIGHLFGEEVVISGRSKGEIA